MFESSKRLIATACSLAVIATCAIGLTGMQTANAAVVTKCSGTMVAAKNILYKGEVIAEVVAYRSGNTACVSTNHLGSTYGKKRWTFAKLEVVRSGILTSADDDTHNYAYRAAVKLPNKGGCIRATGGIYPTNSAPHYERSELGNLFCV